MVFDQSKAKDEGVDQEAVAFLATVISKPKPLTLDCQYSAVQFFAASPELAPGAQNGTGIFY